MTDLRRIWEILWEGRPTDPPEMAELMLDCAWLASRKLEQAIDDGASLPHEQLAMINAVISRLERAKTAVKDKEAA